MSIGIYGIFDSRDMACLYVGQSRNIEGRWIQHLNKIRRKSKNYSSAFLAWIEDQPEGVAILSFRILEKCEDVDALKNRLECEWFERLSPRFFGKKPSAKAYVSHSDATRLAIGQGVASAAKVHRKDEKVPLKQAAPASPFMALSENELRELYEVELLSLKTIGERYGVTQPRVLARFKELEIERRPRGTLTEGQRKPAPILCGYCLTEFIPFRKSRRFCSRICSRRSR